MSNHPSGPNGPSALIPLTGLWGGRTQRGDFYLAGNLNGRSKVVIKKNAYKQPETNDPDYRLHFGPNRQGADGHEDRSSGNTHADDLGDEEGLVPITGLWLGKRQNGEHYLAGNFTQQSRFVVLKNNYKKGSQDPDYKLFIGPNRPRPEPTRQQQDELMDEIRAGLGDSYVDPDPDIDELMF